MNLDYLKNVTLKDAFFAPRQEKGHSVTIPSSIERCRETGRLDAFQLKWKEGDPNMPHVFWDSDVAKVLEGMAYSLIIHPDDKRAAELDKLVDLVISAQQPDGYLNTHYTNVEPQNRWTNIMYNHELYCAGHLMEAAVAHKLATGLDKFVNCMERYADYIATVFGTEEGKKHGYPGHEEIELALCKMYHLTGKEKFLKLAKYFVDERGKSPSFFVQEQGGKAPTSLDYFQAHKPVREQTDAVGHAVRAVYLYSGMTDVANDTNDAELFAAADRLFDSIVSKRMYVTGGIGSTKDGEAFTYDYALPNADAYAESCAAMGLVLFSKRLLDTRRLAKYAEVMERALFNNAISGLSLSGDQYQYSNVLEHNETTNFHEDNRTFRNPWYDCSCCPTSYCRFLPQIGTFCCNAGKDSLRIDIPSAMDICTENYAAEVRSEYPYDGKVQVKITKGSQFELLFRIPQWCRSFKAELNGKDVSGTLDSEGYLVLGNSWKDGDVLTVELEMKAHLVYANLKVSADAGRAAICRGPLVYCVESADNPDFLPYNLYVPAKAEFKSVPAKDLLPGTVALEFDGFAQKSADDKVLYTETAPEFVPVKATAIPYALWHNRGVLPMNVFLMVRF